MGHAKLGTTEMYLNAIGEEQKTIASQMWSWVFCRRAPKGRRFFWLDTLACFDKLYKLLTTSQTS
jgi:hypothetical protein